MLGVLGLAISGKHDPNVARSSDLWRRVRMADMKLVVELGPTPSRTNVTAAASQQLCALSFTPTRTGAANTSYFRSHTGPHCYRYYPHPDLATVVVNLCAMWDDEDNNPYGSFARHDSNSSDVPGLGSPGACKATIPHPYRELQLTRMRT